MYKYNTRDEVPESYKWDLTDLFKDEEEFNNLLEKTKKEVETLENYKGCTKDAKKVYEFLTLEQKVNANVQLLYVYSYLKNDEILGIKENIERKSKTLDLSNERDMKTSFFDEELIKLTEEEYNNLFTICEELKDYKVLLDKIYRTKEHTLSEIEENIISSLINSMDKFSDISSNLINKEHNYGEVELEDGTTETISTSTFSRLMRNNNRNTRKEAYTKFYKKLNEYSGTSAYLLDSYIKGNNTKAKLHKFNNAWESTLFSLNLDDKIFKTLVSTVESNTKPLKKYYNLIKRILKLDELKVYDLGVDLIKSEKEYSIEEAKTMIKEALRPLGEEYVKKLIKILDGRYIDYMPYKGKCNGGYSTMAMIKDSRILINYNSSLTSVSTLAHELGHVINESFIMDNAKLHYRNQPVFVAEVASLANECLLSNYLINNGKTKEEKLRGLENMIKTIRGNLFAATREGKIEQEMYEKINNGGSLSKEYINDLVSKSYKKYQGNEIVENFLDNASWVLRSHYYINFYLYSYAISICVAIAVVTEILSGNEEMLNNYIKFLSTGSDKWPTELFKILEIDLTDKRVYENAINYFNELIDNYEKIYYESEVNKNEQKRLLRSTRSRKKRK